MVVTVVDPLLDVDYHVVDLKFRQILKTVRGGQNDVRSNRRTAAHSGSVHFKP